MLIVLIQFGVIIMLGIQAVSPVSAAENAITEIVVTSQRRAQPIAQHAGSIDRLDSELIAEVQHQHIHELFTRTSGVWVSRGSGQEHLTAIRSPVLTGPGSCGGFLYLEDGIPVRPAGFCNVNQLFEINTEQARSIEIIRGPGNALYGSNALHGTVNVLMPSPGDRSRPYASLELGSNEFARVRFEGPLDPESKFAVALQFADDGGFRDESGYRQWKAHAKISGSFLGGDFTGALSLTDLDQDTAGFIIGEDAYEDPDVNRSNPNPEAFRDAASRRLYGIWSRQTDFADLDVRPFIRQTDMSFLQHFLPGQPLEENGHVSIGALTALTIETPGLTTVAGADIEWGETWLEQTQFGPAEGSDFLRETRPEGKHYDYEVKSFSLAPYFQSDLSVGASWTVGIGLRAEYMYYEYDNRMLDGNTRDDGTSCGFGGCLYSRPADRSDSFVNFAPKLSATYRINPSTTTFIVVARGFRAPQMTELYRLQSGQTVADLDSERIDSIEIGVRNDSPALSLDVAAFAMRKRDSVFRDAQGFNVSGARTSHAGIEGSLDWQMSLTLRLSVDATYARHRYDFNSVAARGETFVSGRDVDTAPRWLGSAELQFDDGDHVGAALQWVYLGDYFLDAENRHDYPGHSLLNFRSTYALNERFAISARINNIFDERYADRADFAFGDYRYFPGRGREIFVEARYSLTADD